MESKKKGNKIIMQYLYNVFRDHATLKLDKRIINMQ